MSNLEGLEHFHDNAEPDGCLKAKHRLKPVDKLIGKIEKVTRGEHPSNAYVVVSIGETDHTNSHASPSLSLAPLWAWYLCCHRLPYQDCTSRDADALSSVGGRFLKHA